MSRSDPATDALKHGRLAAGVSHQSSEQTTRSRLPPILWHGVSDVVYDQKASHFVGVGLVPRKFGQCKSLQDFNGGLANLKAHHSNDVARTLNSDAHIEDAALRYSFNDIHGCDMFTSWSRSWTYALFHVSLRTRRRNPFPYIPDEELMRDIHLMGALTHQLVGPAIDLEVLLKTRSASKREPIKNELARKIETARVELGVLIYGHVPETALFSISMGDFLRPLSTEYWHRLASRV